MNQRHYDAAVRMLRGLTVCNGRDHDPTNAEAHVTLMDVVRGLADVFEIDNEWFDRGRFFAVVYKREEA